MRKRKCGEWLDAIELAKIAIALQSQKWIPASERLPEDESYILVSFENSTMPDIARYEEITRAVRSIREMMKNHIQAMDFCGCLDATTRTVQRGRMIYE